MEANGLESGKVQGQREFQADFTAAVPALRPAASFEILRELEAGDIVLLEAPRDELAPAPTATPNAIKRIKHTHHMLARHLATGMRPAEAAMRTGYSLSRISILQRDPAFKELLSHYGEMQQEAFVDVVERMANVCLDAVEVLQDRLEDDPDSIRTADLVDIIKTTADRGGHSPVARSEQRNLHVVLTAEEAAQIKARVKEAQHGKVQSTVQRRAERLPDNRGLEMGTVIEAERSAVQEPANKQDGGV